MQSVTAWFFNSGIRTRSMSVKILTRSMFWLMYEVIINVH